MSLKTELLPATGQMTHEKINDLRRKVLRGEEVTPEELRDAIKFQAAQRGFFAQKARQDAKVEKVSKKAASKEEQQAKADALLNSLFKL